MEFEEAHQLLLDRHLALRTQEGELKSGYFSLVYEMYKSALSMSRCC